MPRMVLTGFIYRDPEGMFVSHCNELDIDTWAPTLEEVKTLTPRMINGFLEAAELVGTLKQTLEGISCAAPVKPPMAAAAWSAKNDSHGRFETQFQAVT